MSSPTLTVAGAWTAAHDLPTAATWAGRHDGAVTLKGTDKVLVVGGADSSSAALNLAAVYDPATDTWQQAGVVQTPRKLHAVVRLDDGKVLVSGGMSGSSPSSPALAAVELYNPATNVWTSGTAMAQARWGHSAVLLPDKTVLVAGGTTIRLGQSRKALRSAELYDPVSGTWSAVGDMTDARSGHVAVVLQGGKVLVCGGTTPVGSADDPALAFCELYDPATKTWAPTGSLLQPRSRHQATALSATTVLVTGGSAPGAPGDGTFDPFSRRTAERFDLVTGQWSAAHDMPAGRCAHRAFAIGTGKVVVVGGTGGEADDTGYRSAVLYDSVADTWTAVAGLGTGRGSFAAAALSGNRVFVAGGVVRSGLAAADPTVTELTLTAEIFTPGSGV